MCVILHSDFEIAKMKNIQSAIGRGVRLAPGYLMNRFPPWENR